MLFVCDHDAKIQPFVWHVLGVFVSNGGDWHTDYTDDTDLHGFSKFRAYAFLPAHVWNLFRVRAEFAACADVACSFMSEKSV